MDFCDTFNSPMCPSMSADFQDINSLTNEDACKQLLCAIDLCGYSLCKHNDHKDISSLLEDGLHPLDSSDETDRTRIAEITGCVLNGLLEGGQINLDTAICIACETYVRTHGLAGPSATNIGAYACEVASKIDDKFFPETDRLLRANFIATLTICIADQQGLDRSTTSETGVINLGAAAGASHKICGTTTDDLADQLAANHNTSATT